VNARDLQGVSRGVKGFSGKHIRVERLSLSFVDRDVAHCGIVLACLSPSLVGCPCLQKGCAQYEVLKVLSYV